MAGDKNCSIVSQAIREHMLVENMNTFTCQVCKNNMTGIIPAASHLQGSKHKKAVQNSEIEAAMEQICDSPDSSNNIVHAAIRSGIVLSSHVGLQVMLTCTKCNKPCSGEVPMMQHLTSEAHAKKLRLETFKSSISSHSERPTIPNTFTIHYDSALPADQPSMQDVDAAIKSGQVSSNQVDGMKVLTCLSCNKSCSGEVPMKQHLISEAHVKKSRQEVPNSAFSPQKEVPIIPRASIAQHSLPATADVLSVQEDELAQALREGTVRTAEHDANHLQCLVCKIFCTGRDCMKEHIMGKNHIKMQKLLPKLSGCSSKKKSSSDRSSEHDDNGSREGSHITACSSQSFLCTSSSVPIVSHVREPKSEVVSSNRQTSMLPTTWTDQHSHKLHKSMFRGSELHESYFSTSQTDNTPYSDMDIGVWVGKSMTDKERYDLLLKTWRPGLNYQLPYALRSGKKIYLSQNHLDDYPWLAFSHAKSGLYCKFCVAFSQTEGGCGKHELWSLVTKPLTSYDRLSGSDGYLKSHSKLSYHQTNQIKVEEFLKQMSSVKLSVTSLLDDHHKQQIEDNRKGIEGIVHAIIYLGRQGQALRDHTESGKIIDSSVDELSSETSSGKPNDGNFCELLRFAVARGDHALEQYLKNVNKIAAYTSHRTQNYLIECIDEYISEKLTERITVAKYFSVIVEESTDNQRKEQLSISVRYVDDNKIREDFIGFYEIHDFTGHGIARIILEKLAVNKIDSFYLIGQCYNGAGTMSGEVERCEAIIREHSPAAVYVHCAAHALNLVISKSSKVIEIHDCWNDVTEIVNFFHVSSQRIKVLEELVKKDANEQTRQVRLKQFSDTRWVERHDAITIFKKMLPYVVKALEKITTWKSPSTARSFLKKVDFEFVIALYTLEAVLAETKPLSQQLQSQQTDMLELSTQITMTEKNIIEMRKQDRCFKKCFESATEISDNLNIEIKMPRLVINQQHRSNPPFCSIEEYYKRTIFVPYLDSVIVQFHQRFTNYSLVRSLCSLVPSYFSRTTFQDLIPALNIYKHYASDHITDAEDYVVEYKLWRGTWDAVEKHLLPISVCDTLEKCSNNYPVTKTLLQICASLPVSSASAKRSFSTLNHVKSYRRRTMGQNRLNGLAKLYIHRAMSDDYQRVISSVVDIFYRKVKRQVDFVL